MPYQLIEKDLNVSIQAGLSVGGTMITNMEATSVVNLKYETIWNHKLLFKDTNIQSIPKVLLCIFFETNTHSVVWVLVIGHTTGDSND